MECLPTTPARVPAVELYASVGFGFLASSMGDAESSKSSGISRAIEMENLSLDISANRFSRDLLNRFMGSSRDHKAGKHEEEEDDDVELNLGLSLGGRFGVDKSPKMALVRSSSIASCLPTVRDDSDVAGPAAAAALPLARTSSLPVETEEEWRKRKEMQSLRRMEAKRRRSEKQRNLGPDKGGGGGRRGGNLSMEERKEIELNLRGRLDREKTLVGLRRSSSLVKSQLRLSDWTGGGGGSPATGTGNDSSALGKGNGSYAGLSLAGSQGSAESKGGSSSSVSDLESRPMAGSSGELSSGSIHSFQECGSGSQDAGSSATKTKAKEHVSRTATATTTSGGGAGAGAGEAGEMERPDASGGSRGREARGNSLEDMPCVFTKGDGPNGRRVDGILYKYGKGEEVRIMCICHGTFHSPAEFVQHAGGTDLDHPLKHIVVNPNSSSLL